MTDAFIQGAVRGGLIPNINEDIAREAEEQGLIFDTLWRPRQPDVDDEPVDDSEVYELIGVDEEEIEDIELDEFFPRREYAVREENRPYEVDEQPLFNQQEPYDDKLE